MKTIIATVWLVAFAIAEPPPSNSYLPPPPSSRGAGYPSGPAQFGAPEVIAARSFDQPGQRANGAHGSHSGHGSHQANGFARSGHPDHANGLHSRFNPEEQSGYDQNAANFARNALEEINAEPANYNFGYMVNDYQEGTDFGHHEERQEEHAQGEYHVVLPDGRKQTVSYEADERGFKPQISYEDSDDLARSNGYDSNAANIRSNGNHGDGYDSNAANIRSNGNHGNGYDSNAANIRSNHGSGFENHGTGFEKHGTGFEKHGNGFEKHGNGFEKHGSGFDHGNGFENHGSGFGNHNAATRAGGYN